MKHVSLTCVLACTAQAFGFKPAVMRRPARSEEEVPARNAAWLLASELTTFDLRTIGCITGMPDEKRVADGITAAYRRCQGDPDYGELVDAARQAARALARSSIAHRLADPDIAAAAARIARNPAHEAALAPAETVAAMAARLTSLEAVAGATFQLLLKVDALAALDPAYSAEDRVQARALRPEITLITDNLSSALAALGYSPEVNDARADQPAAAE